MLSVRTIARLRGDGVLHFSNKDAVIVNKNRWPTSLCVVMEG
jgi:hypothetical protein